MHRTVWPAFLRSDAAHARNRYSRGAGSAAARRAPHGARARHRASRRWRHGRYRRSFRIDTLPSEPALRSSPDRPSHVRGCRDSPAAGFAGGVLFASATGDEGRSDGRSEIRVKEGWSMRPEHWLFTIPPRLRSLFRWAQADQELDDELRDHLERKTEEYVAQGMTQEEARRGARLDLGGIEQTKEKCRDARRVNWIQDSAQDVRYGLRMLRRSPGFTAVAVLTLSIGIGANTAVFTVVNGVLLRPMPFPAPDRLFLVSLVPRVGPFGWEPGVSDRDYLAFRGQDQVFERTATFTRGDRANLTDAGDPVQIPVSYVTTDFFATLRSHPAIGREFFAGEDQPGRDNIAVISNNLWQERFGSDPQIVGKPIRLDGVARTVIGIMPVGFALPEVKVWMPLAVQIGHNSFIRPVVGRLKPGVSPQQAHVALETFADGLPLGPGEDKSDRWPQIIPLKDLFVANIRRSLLVFAGAVAFVLLIACVNVANLFLARAAGRGHEIAVRCTLGANRWRLVRHLLTESILLSLAGGTAGMLLAFWGVPALTALAPVGTVPRTEMIR